MSAAGLLLHWFVIPVILCATLLAGDAIDWARGRIDLFDPAGVFAIFGLYFFALSPLLMVWMNHRVFYLAHQPSDYRPWLGGMALLNALGLVVYRFTRDFMVRRRVVTANAAWTNPPLRFWITVVALLVISAALQLSVYATYGGISGYIAAYQQWANGVDTFRGKGWLFLISESFPIPAWIAWCVYLRNHKTRATWTLIAVSLAFYFPLLIYFGGLRGSRANIAWGMFWAVGVIHLFVCRIPRYAALLALPLFILFMYVYAFYKDAGVEALNIFRGGGYRKYLTESTARTPEVLLMGDFSRCDIQAYTLYRLVQNRGDFHYALGRTYPGALALTVPKAIWPGRPPAKIKWTTDLEYNAGWYESGGQPASRVYGLAGEAMLNFGPWLVPLMFAFPGVAVGVTRLCITQSFIAPVLVIFCISLVLNDSDVNLVSFIKYAVPLFLVHLTFARPPANAASAAPADAPKNP